MANWFATAPEEQLKGKTAIIMGGGSGIGKATAEQFAAAGANIMVCGVPEQICLDTAEELRAAGGKAVGMVCDGTDANQVQAMIDKTVAEFGDIDILISTAGISLPRMNAMDATEADWDKIFAVNAKANFFLATAVARFMKEKGHGGKMVLISSSVASLLWRTLLSTASPRQLLWVWFAHLQLTSHRMASPSTALLRATL